VFAEDGFAGASLSRLAARAGVAKGLVHHYFGSKRELWEEVKERAGREAAAAASPRPEAGHDLDAIAEWVRRAFAFLRANPDWLRLESWAEIEADHALPPSMRALEREIDALFERARDAGAVRGDVDPVHARAMAHHLLVGWLHTKRFLAPVWGRDPDDPALDDAYLRDVEAVLRAGLAPRGGVSDAPRTAHIPEGAPRADRRRSDP